VVGTASRRRSLKKNEESRSSMLPREKAFFQRQRESNPIDIDRTKEPNHPLKLNMKLSLFAVTLASVSSLVSANSILPENKACAENRFACSAPTSFPTPSSLETSLSIRGGEVIEPTTLSEVEDILMKASAEGKLVAIDFSATWVSVWSRVSFSQVKECTVVQSIVHMRACHIIH